MLRPQENVCWTMSIDGYEYVAGYEYVSGIPLPKI